MPTTHNLGERRPVDPGLNSGQNLDTTSSPTRRRRTRPANHAQYRTKNRRVIVLGNPPCLKHLKVAPRLLRTRLQAHIVRLSTPGRGRLLTRASVHRTRTGAAALVANRTFRETLAIGFAECGAMESRTADERGRRSTNMVSDVAQKLGQ